MVNDLLLLSGNDIPFVSAQITIHQPTIKEIAYIGEEAFFTGCQLLNFSKNILSEEDKVNLEDKSNFDILIAILREQNAVMQKNRNCVDMVLALIFPEYEISFEKDCIKISKENEEHKIDNSNYEEFKSVISSVFSFGNSKDSKPDFNPSGDLAKKIAEKLNKRHQKLAEAKPAQKVDILSRYVSILSVGEQKDMNALLNYTTYQLFDEFKRYELKMGHDIYVQAKMAGAKDLKEVEDWMQDIHS
jgi:hypothetical protein